MVVTNCRMCKSTSLIKYLDLGFTPAADDFLTKERLQYPETHYPLEVFVCQDCGQSQLGYVVPADVLFGKDYVYEMSITAAGKKHWAEFAAYVSKRFKLGTKDLVVDIGSNVGVLLDEFSNNGVKVLGVDPAPTLAKIANDNGIDTICNFFGLRVAKEILQKKGPASVITGTNVFAHINDLDELMKGVNVLLKDDGIFIFESPYFVNLIERLEYDTIYHEHLSYLSVKPLIDFFKCFGMEIFFIEEKDIHGGSFRVYIDRIGNRPISGIVDKLLKREEEANLYSLITLNRFAKNVSQNRQQLHEMLADLKRNNKKIAAVSAPAKGMTLLNYCKIGSETLEFVTEKSQLKIGKFTPGMHLPVVPDSELISKKIDYALLLAWNFADEIMSNLKAYTEAGGKFIIPIPEPRIVG